MKNFLRHSVISLCAVVAPFLLQTVFLTLTRTVLRPLAALDVPALIFAVCIGLIIALFLPVKSGFRPVFGIVYFAVMTTSLFLYSVQIVCSRFGNCF